MIQKGEWIEIIDEFGRTRLVRQQDAKRYQVEQDAEPGLVSKDMLMEQERKKWEENIETERCNFY